MTKGALTEALIERTGGMERPTVQVLAASVGAAAKVGLRGLVKASDATVARRSRGRPTSPCGHHAPRRSAEPVCKRKGPQALPVAGGSHACRLTDVDPGQVDVQLGSTTVAPMAIRYGIIAAVRAWDGSATIELHRSMSACKRAESLRPSTVRACSSGKAPGGRRCDQPARPLCPAL